jgi:hypothetical protein
MKARMTIVRVVVTLFGILQFSTARAADESVGVLYLQNNSNVTGHIFVDGEYQGDVPPDKARYTVREGFVTRNSGVQPDASIKQNYSHGGWSSKGSIVVSITGADPKTRYETKITVSGDSEHKAYVWWGDRESGPEPERLVWETSSQIVSGKQPVTPNIKWVFQLAASTRYRSIVGTWLEAENSKFLSTWVFSPDGKYKHFDKQGYSQEGTYMIVGDKVKLSYTVTGFPNVPSREGTFDTGERFVTEITQSFRKVQ